MPHSWYVSVMLVPFEYISAPVQRIVLVISCIKPLTEYLYIHLFDHLIQPIFLTGVIWSCSFTFLWTITLVWQLEIYLFYCLQFILRMLITFSYLASKLGQLLVSGVVGYFNYGGILRYGHFLMDR